jgi:hypothetical protein
MSAIIYSWGLMLATRHSADCRLRVDAVEKGLLEDLCATLIQSTRFDSKVDSDDSIVAFQEDAADFFDSIGHQERLADRVTSVAGFRP